MRDLDSGLKNLIIQQGEQNNMMYMLRKRLDPGGLFTTRAGLDPSDPAWWPLLPL